MIRGRTMKRLSPRGAAIVFMAASALLGAGRVVGAVRLLRPSPAREMTLTLDTKTSLYYRLDAEQPAVVSAKGPSTLKLIVRAIPSAAHADTIPFKVAVTEGGHPVAEIDTRTSPSRYTWQNSSEACSESRSVSIPVPTGVHEYRVRFESPAAGAAAVRYVLRAAKTGSPQSQLYPAAHEEAVTVLVREKPLDYFLASSRNPVTVRVVGPTTLRVVSRLVYRNRDKGRQLYTLLAKCDGKVLPDWTFETEKSLLAECVQYADWNLGRSQTTMMPVPKGIHEYSFQLSGDRAPAVALRFSIPREDLRNGN